MAPSSKAHFSPPALLLIDIQQGFEEKDYYGGERNNPEAEQRASDLLLYWRQKQWPVIHVHHHSTDPQSPLHPSKDGVAPHPLLTPIQSEFVYVKSVHSAFIESLLEEELNSLGIKRLVFTGITTNHCVSSNVRMAHNLGFDCWVITDATAAFDQIGPAGERLESDLIHQVALASLGGEFAQLIDSATLMEQADEGRFPMA